MALLREFLDTAEENVYPVNPDALLGTTDDAVCFIWGPQSGLLVGDHAKATHWELMSDYAQELGSELDEFDPTEVNQNELLMRERLQRKVLFGRAGTTADHDDEGNDTREWHCVAFWNFLPGQLEPCLQDLLKQRIVTPDTVVSVPKHVAAPVRDWLAGGGERREEDDAARQRRELQQRLHLLRGDEKRAALAQLGLSPGSVKHPWQQGAEAAGVVQPGQKWWAPTSEAKRRPSRHS